MLPEARLPVFKAIHNAVDPPAASCSANDDQPGQTAQTRSDPARHVLSRSVHKSPFSLSLYDKISLLLYFSPPFGSATTYNDLLVLAYKTAIEAPSTDFDGLKMISSQFDIVEVLSSLGGWVDMRLTMLRPLLKGMKLERYDTFIGQDATEISWEELRNHMQAAFPPPKTDQYLQNAIRLGPNRQIEPYLFAMLIWCRRHDPTMDEDHIVCQIKTMLHPTLSTRIGSRQNSLETIFNELMAIELNPEVPNSDLVYQHEVIHPSL